LPREVRQGIAHAYPVGAMACRAHGGCQIFSGLDIRGVRYLRDGQKNGQSKDFFHGSTPLVRSLDSVAAEGAAPPRSKLTVNQSIAAWKSDHPVDRVRYVSKRQSIESSAPIGYPCRTVSGVVLQAANDRSQVWASQARANRAGPNTTNLAMHA